MEHNFSEFFKKYPSNYAEGHIIQDVYYAVKAAKKAFKEDKESQKYLKYLTKAFNMLGHYLAEKGYSPDMQGGYDQKYQGGYGQQGYDPRYQGYKPGQQGYKPGEQEGY